VRKVQALEVWQTSQIDQFDIADPGAPQVYGDDVAFGIEFRSSAQGLNPGAWAGGTER